MRVVTVHSWQGGSGRSTAVANLGYLLAQRGLRVALVDASLQAPGLHCALGLPDDTFGAGLSDYLRGGCGIDEVFHDVGARLAVGGGTLVLVPARPDPGLIARCVLGRGYDPGLFHESLRWLDETLGFEAVLIDTHAGVNPEAVNALAVADLRLVLAAPGARAYAGARTAGTIARQVNRNPVLLVVTMLGSGADPAELADAAAAASGLEVAALLPNVPKLGERCEQTDAWPFVRARPRHRLTAAYRSLTDRIIAQLALQPAPQQPVKAVTAVTAVKAVGAGSR